MNVLRLTLPASLVRDLFRTSNGERWGLSADDFAASLEASVAQAFPNADPADSDAREIRTYAERLHLEDLALACACMLGRDAAWDHFVLTHRPILYRAADALDPSGGARELADTLYGDLFGAKTSGDGRALFSYFHGRSTLATWLRAVLSQRYVDLVRSRARLQSLPDEDAAVRRPDFAKAPSGKPCRPNFAKAPSGKSTRTARSWFRSSIARCGRRSRHCRRRTGSAYAVTMSPG